MKRRGVNEPISIKLKESNLSLCGDSDNRARHSEDGSKEGDSDIKDDGICKLSFTKGPGMF